MPKSRGRCTTRYTDGYCPAEDDCNGRGRLGLSRHVLHPSDVRLQVSACEHDRHLHRSDSSHPAWSAIPRIPSVSTRPTSRRSSQYYTDLTNNALPSFAFIAAGYGLNDEHPGSNGSILTGQTGGGKIVNAFMASPEWKRFRFFFSYDEGGGPYDHVPPVPGHTNDSRMPLKLRITRRTSRRYR